ncbi:MAG: DUF11 domain-containing protein, partial [Nitrosopumilus sp.]
AGFFELPDLRILKSVDDTSPLEGALVTYTITIENKGPVDLTLIVIEDMLPMGVTFVSASESEGAYDDGTGLWTGLDMVSGELHTLEITVTVDAGTAGDIIMNMASYVSSSPTDPFPSDATATIVPT